MRNIKLLLAYDGTEYHGWERQKDQRTLQQTLEQAIESLTGEAVSVIASGRTDAGVHALGQVANFHSNTRHDCATIRQALNALLPGDFRVLSVEDVGLAFHATYAAKVKLYRYAMHDGPVMDPFLRRYVYHCNWQMDHTSMHQAAQCLMGTHDFSSFETAGAPRETSVRTIAHIAVFRDGPERFWAREPFRPSVGGQRAELREQGADSPEQRPEDSHQPSSISDPPSSVLHPRSTVLGPRSSVFDPRSSILGPPLLPFLEVAADGFLYNMVRAIAGTLINVGRGYWPVQRVREILESRDRTVAGPTAPAHGLFLVRVEH